MEIVEIFYETRVSGCLNGLLVAKLKEPYAELDLWSFHWAKIRRLLVERDTLLWPWLPLPYGQVSNHQQALGKQAKTFFCIIRESCIENKYHNFPMQHIPHISHRQKPNVLICLINKKNFRYDSWMLQIHDDICFPIL